MWATRSRFTSTSIGSLGRPPIRAKMKYFQQQDSAHKIFDRHALAALPARRRKQSAADQERLRELRTVPKDVSLEDGTVLDENTHQIRSDMLPTAVPPSIEFTEHDELLVEELLHGGQHSLGYDDTLSAASPSQLQHAFHQPYLHSSGENREVGDAERTERTNSRDSGISASANSAAEKLLASFLDSDRNVGEVIRRRSSFEPPRSNMDAHLHPQTAAQPETPKRRKKFAFMQDLESTSPSAVTDALSAPNTSAMEAVSVEDENDDVVMDDMMVMESNDMKELSATAERDKLGVQHPAARGVGHDVIELVTDAFRAERERLIAKRRAELYRLTHPDPLDYQYDGKLLPPPPLSFGRVTNEAIMLGNEMLRDQHYSLVRKVAPSSENVFFFELNHMYQEIVLVGRACAGKSSLLNAILGQDALAKTSSLPNSTRSISFYQSVTAQEMQDYASTLSKKDRGNSETRTKERRAGDGGLHGGGGTAKRGKEFYNNPNNLLKLPGNGMQLTFVDLPGFGIEGMSEKWRDNAIAATDSYLGVRRSVNTVLLCIDVTQGLTKADLKYFTWLENLHGVFWIILTKCDDVSHARVCSVMRQVYEQITKFRKKYRKVFPFILPVSAKDGTNIDVLRGLLMETSGIISGDRLREMLRQKRDKQNEEATRQEEARLHAVRELERREAKKLFLESRSKKDGHRMRGEKVSSPMPSHGTHAPMQRPSLASRPQAAEVQNGSHNPNYSVRQSASTPAGRQPPQGGVAPSEGRYVPPSSYLLDLDDAQLSRSRSVQPMRADAQRSPMEQAREAHLARRRQDPLPREDTGYGSRFKLNTGLEASSAGRLELPSVSLASEYNTTAGGEAPAEQNDPASSRFTPSVAPRVSSVLGLSANADDPMTARGASMHAAASNPDSERAQMRTVSAFLDKLDALKSSSGVGVASRQNSLDRDNGAALENMMGGSEFDHHSGSNGGESNHKQPRLSKQQRHEVAIVERDKKRRKFGGTRVYLPLEDGRLSEVSAGRRVGPLVPHVGAVDARKSAWLAQQYANLALSESPTAPWAAQDALRKRYTEQEQDGTKPDSNPAKRSVDHKPVSLVESSDGSESTGVMRRSSVATILGSSHHPTNLKPNSAVQPGSRQSQLRHVMRHMTKRQLKAYLRQSGRIVEGFDKFDGEVTLNKYMRENRQAKTLRSREQMHLNSTAKINYNSMPVGMWKQYGAKDTYWPTTSVLGRDGDTQPTS